MPWSVLFHSDFQAEFDALPRQVRLELLARLKVLELKGPQLGRPTVDTLAGSSFANMKELRFQGAGGVWRFAFASIRNALPLCCAEAISAASIRRHSTRSLSIPRTRDLVITLQV
ncbi:MAG TPA: type II toxin-antitoxin system RelE/ParE family toxin [Xanthobacteraceae bacterium]